MHCEVFTVTPTTRALPAPRARLLVRSVRLAACALALAMLSSVAALAQAQAQPQAQAKIQTPAPRGEAAPKARHPSALGAKTTVVSPASGPQRKAVRKRAAPPAPSVGQLSGLHRVGDELALKSAVALVIDRDTDEVLFSKNAHAVLPIASITKLMTALVVVESGEALDEPLAVMPEDVRATAGSNSRRRLATGTQISRGEMLRLALMASENRAAYALGRSHPGGAATFVEAMNAKALQLGMRDTRFVEPTGLSSENRSSAQDLALLVRAASAHPIIREYSTTADAVVDTGRRQMQFRNTNGLVRDPDWEIAVQNTGYIAAAGRCVVMQAQMAGRQLIMVLLDSVGRHSRIGDAQRLRDWLFFAATPATTTSSLVLPAPLVIPAALALPVASDLPAAGATAAPSHQPALRL